LKEEKRRERDGQFTFTSEIEKVYNNQDSLEIIFTLQQTSQLRQQRPILPEHPAQSHVGYNAIFAQHSEQQTTRLSSLTASPPPPMIVCALETTQPSMNAD